MKIIYGILTVLLLSTMPVMAQDAEKANEVILKMQHDLNLSSDQVANITQIVERYEMASTELQQSIKDGTMNPSSVDSQTQELREAEEEGISQYLRPDQLYVWRQIENQVQPPPSQDGGDGDTGSERYTNFPYNPNQ